MCILLNVKKHEKTFALNVDIFIYLSCIKFLLKVCSNHGIIGLDYFILRHGHFAHGYYIW